MNGSGASRDEAVASRTATSDDFRSELRAFRQRLEAHISTRKEVLELLSAPLALVGVAPLYDEGRDSGRLARPEGRSFFFEESAAASRKSGRDHIWLADLQEVLLEKVLVDWEEALDEVNLFNSTIGHCFCPSSGQPGAGCVQLATLSSLTLHLSKRAISSSSKLAHSRTNVTLRILEALIERIDLPAVIAYIIDQVQKPQQELTWNTACRLLTTLPDRAANVFGLQLPETLGLQRWQRVVGNQIEKTVQQQRSAELVGALLSRCLQSKWLQVMPLVASEGYALSHLLQNCAQQLLSSAPVVQDYKRKWSSVLQCLPLQEQDDLFIDIVTYLDWATFRRAGHDGLISSKEKTQPGAEGTLFMAAATIQRTKAAADLIELFVVEDSDTDGSLDGEEEDGQVAESSLSRTIVGTSSYSSAPPWTPGMARVLVGLLHRTGHQSHDLLGDILDRATAKWSDGVRTSSNDVQIYLTLVILLVIALLPDKSKTIDDLALSASFTQGVSAHLEHLSPIVRRLGMLVAEVVAQKAGRDLSFGRKAWDGRGEGREEARVLRTAMLVFPTQLAAHEDERGNVLDILDVQDQDAPAKGTNSALMVAPKARPSPLTKRLPRRATADKPLVQALDVLGDDARDDFTSPSGDQHLPSLFNVGSVPNLNPLVREYASDSESASSSDTDSSDDGEPDLPPNAAEEGKAFGMGAPTSKRKARPPIYISELAPLLRANERASIRMGLRSAKALIERKSGWGGEVHDNAVNVTLALIGLNNNFRIAKFEERRLAALVALVVASPERVAPCLIEQYFVHQYSVAQRIAMLNALAFGARILSSDEAAHSAELSDTQRGLEVLSRDLAQLAIARARKEGEDKVPAIQREQALLVDSMRQRETATLPGRKAKPQSPFLAVAQRSFIFPLVNRFWAYLQDASAAKKGRQLGGSGSSIIDMPFLLGAFLDTLAVLCFFAQHDVQFRQSVVPEVLELTLTVSRPLLIAASAMNDQRDEPHNMAGGSRSTVLGAAASLVLVLLDAAWQLDAGYSFTSHHAHLFVEVQQWAAAIFETSDGGGADRSSIGQNERAARSSAALLLRLSEMRDRRRGG